MERCPAHFLASLAEATESAWHHASVSQTLERARAGDEQAFRELTGPHLRELHLHCYRMLGSLVDAEDLLQETLTAAWRGLDGYAGRSSLRAWLYRIATNRCLNAIRDNKRRRPPEPVPPFDPPEPSRRGEITWLQPYPDAWIQQAAERAPGPAARYQARESVELAFIVALQRLPARQTAALVLCDVLGFALAEAASMLGTSRAAVKGALQRARANLDQHHTTSVHGVVLEPGSTEEQDLARRFADAYTADDIDGVVALLTDDAWLAMPPAPHEYQGRQAIASFLRTSATWRERLHLRLVPTRANNQPAFGCYFAEPDVPTGFAAGLLVLTVSENGISNVARFLDSELTRIFEVAEAAR